MLSEQEGIILVVNIAFSYKQRESVAHKIVLGAINDGENSFRILKTTTLKAIADYVKVDTRNSGVVNANFAEMNYISKNGTTYYFPILDENLSVLTLDLVPSIKSAKGIETKEIFVVFEEQELEDTMDSSIVVN
jgi:hypothetical protein